MQAQIVTAPEAARSDELWVVLARTERARRRLARRHDAVLTELGLPQASPFIDREGGFAVMSPPAATLRDGSTLFVHGDISGADLESVARWLRAGDLARMSTLAGSFVWAFWNARDREFSLARDALGQRSLFMRRVGDFDVFDCDLSRLLAQGCELDCDAALNYLACGIPSAGHTLAQDVARVPAGHQYAWRAGEPVRTSRYFSPLHDAAELSDTSDLRASLQQELSGTIARGFAAGSERGVLLSGGLDSSYLAALSANAGAGRLRAYTIEFDPSYGLNETHYAELVAKKFGLRHRAIRLDAQTALARLDEVLAQPEPCAAWATLTHRQLALAAREDGVQLLASGLGADEVLGSYRSMLEHYFAFRALLEQPAAQSLGVAGVWDALLRDPTLARQALFPGVAQFFSESALQRALARSQPARGWDPVPTRQAFYRECLALKPNAHVYELMVAHECQYRIPELLFANFETASREIGVRLLYPYLTPRFVRLVSGLKASARFMRGEGQWISKLPLRRLASPLLPEEIVRRPRGSYTTAFAYWMQLPAFSRPTLARLERSAFWKLGLVSKAWHKRLVGVVSHASAPTSPEGSASLYQLWALLTLVSWYDRFVMRKI